MVFCYRLELKSKQDEWQSLCGLGNLLRIFLTFQSDCDRSIMTLGLTWEPGNKFSVHAASDPGRCSGRTYRELLAKGGSGCLRRGISFFTAAASENALLRQRGSLTPSHCLFLVITSTPIESMGQGEARTLVWARGTANRCSLTIIAEKGRGVWRADLQSFHLLKLSLPLRWRHAVVCCSAPGVGVGLLVPLPWHARGDICSQ